MMGEDRAATQGWTFKIGDRVRHKNYTWTGTVISINERDGDALYELHVWLDGYKSIYIDEESFWEKIDGEESDNRAGGGETQASAEIPRQTTGADHT
jgi:hypothetical protein